MSKTRILVGVLALCGLASVSLTPLPAHGQIQAVSKLNVYDANGQKVGKVFGLSIGLTANTIVAFKARGIPFTLNLGDPSPFFHGWIVGSVYFANPGCAGQAYMIGDPGLTGSAMVFPPNASVYISDPKDSPSIVTWQSSMDESGTCFPVSQGSRLLRPAISVGDLLPRFTPPFTVK